MARRREVEIFSLSMLDTITCGLAGVIVLLLFIASQIPPGAEVIFVNAAATGQSSGAEESGDTAIATGLLTVLLEFDEPRDASRHRPQPCIGAPASAANEKRLRIARLGDPDPGRLFAPADTVHRFGYMLWWHGVLSEMPASFNCFSVETGGGCRFSYVAGAHYSTWAQCPPNGLVFERVEDTFFERTR